MSNPLNFTPMDKAETAPLEEDDTPRRWKSREPASPTRRPAGEVVQMSLRMEAGTYSDFRQLCIDERMTNGDMLQEMLWLYRSVKEVGDAHRYGALQMMKLMRDAYLQSEGGERSKK